MKLAHIKDIILDGKRFRAIRRRHVTWQEPKLKNKGALTRTMEDLENTTRDAVGIDTNSPTHLLSREARLLKDKYDESKYERETSKQQREILKLSRDFESLTTKDEKSGSSEAGHAADPLDLPAQQFSLGSWIGSTSMPGSSRSTQRRRKPEAELIRRKGGTVRPCHGSLLAAPQTLPVAGPSITDICVFGSSAAPHLTSLQCLALPPTTPGCMYTFMATANSLRLPATATAKDENKAGFGKLSNGSYEE